MSTGSRPISGQLRLVRDRAGMSLGDATRLAAGQHGLLTRRQALTVGLNREAVARLVRPAGSWQRVLPGVYATSRDPLTGEQRARAGLLYAGEGAALTAASACLLLGLRSTVDDGRVHVAVPHRRHRMSLRFVCIHRTIRHREVELAPEGLPVVTYARAVVDYGLESKDLGNVRAVACFAVTEGRTSVDALAAELADAPQQESAVIRRVVGDLLAGIRSAPEGQVRDLIIAGGLPEARYNVPVYTADGEWIATPDVSWDHCRVVLEVDSVEFHYLTEADQLATEQRRRRLEQHGFIVISVTPYEIRTNPAGVLAAIRAAVCPTTP